LTKIKLKGCTKMVNKGSELFLSTEILKTLPSKVAITRIEYEGPMLAIYTRNPEVFYSDPSIISSLASRFKRRFVIRSEPDERLDISEAISKISSILSNMEIPLENYKIFFDESRGEVTIFLSKYLTSDEKNKLFYTIVKETKWIPVLKWFYNGVPTVFSKIFYKPKYKKAPLNFLSSIGDRVFRTTVNPSKAIRITALGGAEEVGRSAILVSTTESKILIDFGIKVNVSIKEYAFPRIDLVDFDINDLDGIVLTHAHLDHSGLLPFLYKYGYRGPVYMTEPTLPLTVLLLDDLLEISSKYGNPLPYNEHDINTMIRHTIPLKYNQVTDISPDIKLTFFNAGHILGSALVHLHITEGVYNILFTGDFKYGKTRLLNHAEKNFSRVETLVMESTYGGRFDILPLRSDAEAMFSLIIKKTLDRGGKVLIPVPGVGRAQEVLAVLYLIYRKKLNNLDLPEVPVYIDGMIEEANKIHGVYVDYLNARIKRDILNYGENPFNADYIVPVDTSAKRDEVIRDPSSSIIISTSGMMQGGPVIEYFKYLSEDERNSLIFVTYQSPETLGRKIVDGARNIDIMENGRLKTIKIKMEVHKIDGFTGHSDRRQLLGYVKTLQHLLKNIYTVHGEPEKINNLSQTIEKFFGIPTSKLPMLSTIQLK